MLTILSIIAGGILLVIMGIFALLGLMTRKMFLILVLILFFMGGFWLVVKVLLAIFGLIVFIGFLLFIVVLGMIFKLLI